MKKYLTKHGWWMLLILGTIGLCFTNYYVIMAARILWIVGFALILVRFFNWVETWKLWKRKI